MFVLTIINHNPTLHIMFLLPFADILGISTILVILKNIGIEFKPAF